MLCAGVAAGARSRCRGGQNRRSISPNSRPSGLQEPPSKGKKPLLQVWADGWGQDAPAAPRIAQTKCSGEPRDLSSGLAAGHAHMARKRRALVPPIDHEIMSLGFARDCLINRSIQEFIVFRSPQRTTKVSGIILTQAHVERAGTGNTDTVARFTEIMS